MEKETIEKMNIEKNKELFAYEMTEVLLMLKGEFAAVSGSELGYSQYHVSEEKRNAPLDVIQREQMPEIQIQPAHIAAYMGKDVADIIASVERGNAKQEITVKPPRLVLPKPGIPQILQLDKEQKTDVHCTVSVPRISTNVTGNIPVPVYSLPKVHMPVKKNLPEVTIPQLPVECAKTVIPMTDAMIVHIPEVECKQIRIGIPEISNLTVVTAPVDQCGEKTILDEETQKHWETVCIPEIPAVSIPAVTLCHMAIDMPEINSIWP